MSIGHQFCRICGSRRVHADLVDVSPIGTRPGTELVSGLATCLDCEDGRNKPVCPVCGSSRYRINWIDSGLGGAFVDLIPSTLHCLNCEDLAESQRHPESRDTFPIASSDVRPTSGP